MSPTADPAPGDLATLRAVIDLIVPADETPGALDLGTDRYVLARLAPFGEAHAIRAGLAALHDFTALSPAGQHAALLAVEREPWFRQLVELVQEGFYANPANGGNAGAASWQLIGYHHRLPEGPDGPPLQIISLNKA